MTYLADTVLPERVRWFIQMSQARQGWECVQCGSLARGIVYFTKNRDGKEVRRTRNDYETICHTDKEGEGNRLVHKATCWVLVEIVKVLGEQEPEVVAKAIEAKIVTRKCGCTFQGAKILKPCERDAKLWKM